MSIATLSQRFTLSPEDNTRLQDLCGQYNENLQLISQRLGVNIKNRAFEFTVIGSKDAAEQATHVILNLYEQTKEGSELDMGQVHLAIQTQEHQLDQRVFDKGIRVKTRSANQQKYINNIQQHTVNFGVGPAGTGKTYLAAACAVDALLRDKIQRIILVRPAVEAGEKLGFLPGDLSQKVDPYLRPLYDSLFELIGIEKTERFLEKGIIEVAPLAYMRGRTLNNAFVILDESQNTTTEQMKMFLTRIGFGSTAVVNGDVTQIDLPKRQESGLVNAIKVLKDVFEISFTFFESVDVVRHPIVQSVIAAYESYKPWSILKYIAN